MFNARAFLHRPRIADVRDLARGAMRPFGQRVGLPPEAAERPEPGQIDVPILTSSAEDRARAQILAQGRHLARQQDWAELGALIRAADSARALTPGGASVAELLAAGAREDAVSAACAAVGRSDADAASRPIADLRDELDALSLDHGVALVVVRAHLDLGTAWLRQAADRRIGRAGFHTHFNAARKLLDAFDPVEADAASLAAARCAVLPGTRGAAARVIDDYDDLIDLDPRCARHLSALGRDMMPDRFGSHAALHEAACRSAARTADIWGMGGYVWTCLDAIAADPSCVGALDPALFVEGLHDILATRPDQAVVNRLAALTGFTLACGPDAPPAHRAIATSFCWIVTDHLREVHPRVWAAAPSPVATAAPADGPETGAARALSSIGRLFADDLAAGRSVRAGPEGWTYA